MGSTQPLRIIVRPSRLLTLACGTLVSAAVAQPFPCQLYQAEWAGEMVLVDLNEDGADDAVVTNTVGDAVSVLFGDGSGGFGLPVSFPMGAEPSDVASGDFNGDGHADVLVTIYGSGKVSVLLGDGSGGLLTQINTTVGVQPSRVVAADLDADGTLDLVVLTDEGFAAEDGLNVLMGNGDGTFQSPQRTSMPGGAIDVVQGDWDQNGVLDLAVLNPYSDTVSILNGNGDGTFQAAGLLATEAFPRSIAMGDVDSDGSSDLMVACFSAAEVQLFRGKPGGVFLSATPVVAEERVGLRLADVDGDGVLDLVSPVYEESKIPDSFRSFIEVRPGNGDGTFGAAQEFLGGAVPGRVIVRDINGDGRSDLLAPNSESQAISVHPAMPDGGFRTRTDVIVYAPANDIGVGDFDEDGVLDLVTCGDGVGTSGSRTTVQRGLGDGSFEAPVYVEYGSGNTGLAVTDLDGDGHSDLLLASSDDDAVSIMLGQGDGTFGSGVQHAVGDDPRAVVAADLNGDGLPDLLTPNFGADSVSVLVGGAGGSFTPAPDLAVGRRPIDLAVGDLNGDSNVDVVVANSSTMAPDFLYIVTLYIGSGDAAFGSRQDLVIEAGAGARPYSVAVADINGDGDQDIVVGCWTPTSTGIGTGRIAVLLGNGDGTFASPTYEPVGNTLGDVDVVDLDGDGVLDLVAADKARNAGIVSVLRGVGDGSFLPREIYATAEPAAAVVGADFNGDGSIDIATAGMRQISILLAQSVACAGDITGEGDLNFFDIAAYISLYNASDPAADLADPIGTLNFFDIAAYISLYNAGCP